MRIRLLIGFIALSAGTVAAQSEAASNPWAFLAGCWVQEVDASGPSDSAITCVLPAHGDPLAADFLTYVGERETRRSRIVADGTRRAFETETCRGSETARFALDGGRVFLQSEIACGVEKPTRSTGILALTESHRFLRVLGGGAGDAAAVRFALQRRLPFSEAPRAVHLALEEGSASSLAPYGTAALTPAIISEASSALSVPVIEIWLAAHSADASAPFALTTAADQELEDAGVPERVRALLDALHRPERFLLTLSSAGAAVRPLSLDPNARFRELAAAFGGASSVSVAGAAHDSQTLTNATSVPVASACLGARVLMTSGFGTYGASPAFAHVLFARVCPTNGFYDPQTMNAVLYGAYGGPGGGEPGGRSRPRDSGQSGDETPAADGARRRTPGTGLEGGASYGRPSSHPAPEAIPLGGLGTPTSSPSAPASSAPATPPVRLSPRERTP